MYIADPGGLLLLHIGAALLQTADSTTAHCFHSPSSQLMILPHITAAITAVEGSADSSLVYSILPTDNSVGAVKCV